ncbi:MAG TPA: hypothetical protein VFS39_06690 [Nitrospira sp.]|nr:hypothetical protein [Nitrospira sp.]
MKHQIKNIEDLRWFMGHTGGFRGGYVTDVQMSKRRLFDEGSAREVLADTIVTVVVRYRLRQMERVAKLTMTGVTDFSVFEQEGADCSSLGVIQAECTAEKLRFWFDPQGELYVVCDEAQVEEVAMPFLDDRLHQPAQWTFQSPVADWPTVEWLLDGLDSAGLPCIWKGAKASTPPQSNIQWEGRLLPASVPDQADCGAVRVMLYGPLDGPGFGIVLNLIGGQSRAACRVLSTAADLLVSRFSGQCLVGNTIIPGGEWLNWKSLEHQRWTNAANDRDA